MAVYWVSFRIANTGQYDKRYAALIETLQSEGTMYWAETTSFVILESELNIDQLARRIGDRIDRKWDAAVVGMPEIKAMRVVGAVGDQDIYKLVPFAKPA